MGSGGIGVNIQPLPAAAALATATSTPKPAPAPAPAPAATSTPKPATSVAAGNQAAIAAVKAAAASTPKPAPAAITPEIARDLMVRSMTTGVPTSEFDRYGGYNAVAAVYNNSGGTYSLDNVPKETLTSLANTVAQTGVGNLSVLKLAGVPLSQAGYENMIRNGIDPASAASYMKQFGSITPLTNTGNRANVLPMLGAIANWSTPPNFAGAGLSGVSGYTGPQPTDYSSILSARPVGWDGTSPRPTGSTGQPASGTVVPGPGSETPLTPTIVPSFMDYTSRGVGAIGDVGGIRMQGPSMPVFGNERLGGGAATNPNSYFAQTPQTSTGLAPGSAAIGPAEMPLYGAMNTMGAIGANPNLSPTMLGGQENAGMYTDRLGNRIYSPGMPPLRPPGYAKGGAVDLDALAQQNAENLSDEEPEEAINTNPVGTAQQMLADLAGTERSSPTRMAVKRTKTSGGGASADKAIKMSAESLAKGDLGAMKETAAAKAAPESARAQMEELARVYQLRMAAARNKARGLSADTFGAPTLEGATLTKNTLAKKRFAKGGEAKKPEAEVAEPSLFGVSDYATKASARMFPDQLGQDDQRDAARHMLAAGSIARKYGPKAAELLGKAHEYTSNPQTFFSMFGIGQPRDDLPYDVHNNRIGAELAARATSQADLERLVQALALQAQTKQTKDKPYIMSREQMQARKEKAEKGPSERPQGYQKGGMVKALKGTKAVDKEGRPLTAYRGEYGPSDKLSTELGSYSFGTKDAANLYATEPNNFSNAAEAMKVFPAQLSIRKPVVNAPGDSYIDLPALRKALGKKEFDRVIQKNAGSIEDTQAFEDLADAKGYTSVLDLMKKNPKDLDSLYTQLYPILDDPKSVKVLQKRGYDGAIYGGSGATGGEAEYRVFSASQAISPYGNKPMAPRSARQQMGDFVQSMDMSPTDALGFFGKAASAAGTALTPSILNEGEKAELERRRAMPATVDRAKGGAVKKSENKQRR